MSHIFPPKKAKEPCIYAKRLCAYLKWGSVRRVYCGRHVCPCKSPICPQMSHIFPQMSHIFPQSNSIKMLCAYLKWGSVNTSSLRQIYVSMQKSYMSTNEPYIPGKELCISAKKLCEYLKWESVKTSSLRQPYTSTKQPYVSAKETHVPANKAVYLHKRAVCMRIGGDDFCVAACI